MTNNNNNEEREKLEKKVNDFVQKVMNNEDARLKLSVIEAQEVIWWWIYTEEFNSVEDTEEAIENLRVEFVYKHSNEDVEDRYIQQRIYDVREASNDTAAWMPVSINELLDNLDSNSV
ncbi:MAG: hypothetical protein ACOCV8_05365 [Spirochaetota bacterium]